MKFDYASAASRHLRDARVLAAQESWDNAAYLAGYVGECGIKAVIEKAGILLRRHLPAIRPEHLLVAADLSLAARRYQVDLDADLGTLRSDWTTDLRYAKTGTIDESTSGDLLVRAGRVFDKTIGAMVLDGLLDRLPK